MPSAGAPQVPQQEANPNPPASSPEPAISPTPKKGKGLIKTLVGVFAIAILGFGGWYAYDSGLFGGASDDNPPALSIGGSSFQGKSVETTFGFLQFDAADVSSFSDAGKNLKAVSKGVNYFAPLRNTSFEEIEASIQPADDLKILIAHYDKAEPWAGDTSKNGCFKVYPVGPYDKTCEVTANKLGSAVVTKNTSIAIIASADFEIDSGLLADAKTLTDTLILSGPNGWSMHPLASNMDLSDTRITNLWVQKSANEFEKVTDIANLDISREYKMAWFKLGDPPVAGDTTPAPAVCGDGNVDSGEACDDGTNNSDTVANACRTSCVVADCGDGVVDAGEECDGTEDCEADCTLTVVEPVAVCGNSVVEEGEVCDDGDTNDANACSNDCQTIRSMVEVGDGTDEVIPFKTAPEEETTETFEMATTLVPLEAVMIAPTTTTTTPTSTAIYTTLEYIDNLEAQFTTDTTNWNDYRKGDLYGDLDDGVPAIMAALNITIGTGAGPSKLTSLKFSNNGYTLGRQPPAHVLDYKTAGVDPSSGVMDYCNGETDWSVYLYYQEGNTLYRRILFNKNDIVSGSAIELLNTTLEFNSADKEEEVEIPVGINAVITLEMTGLSACRQDYQPGEISTSEANFTELKFENQDGVVAEFNALGITNAGHDHWINWLNTDEMPFEMITTFAPMTAVPMTAAPSETGVVMYN